MKNLFREFAILFSATVFVLVGCQSHHGDTHNHEHDGGHDFSPKHTEEFPAASIEAEHSLHVTTDGHAVKIVPKRNVRILVWIDRPDDCTYKLHVDADGGDFTKTIERHASNDNKQHPDKGHVITLKEGTEYTVWIEADLRHNPVYGSWVRNDGHPSAPLHGNRLEIHWHKHPVFANAYFEVQG